MTFSAVFLGVLGLLLLFAPEEAGGFLVQPYGATPLVQLLAGALLGFGVINWMARSHKLGGIYGRNVVAGNQMHFTVGAIALVKHGLRAGGTPVFWLVAAAYVVLALFFNQLLFGWRLPFLSAPRREP